MVNEKDIIIRRFEPKDKNAVRSICSQTALLGDPSAIFFDDDEVFADALTGYFTDYEPESCFVAEDGGRVVGYLLGTKDTKRADSIFSRNLAIPLFLRALSRFSFFRRKNMVFFLRLFMSLIRGEFNDPDLSQSYPATLHINTDKDYRSRGIGSRLMEEYLKYLREQHIKGVRLATLSDKASIFFARQGFILLFKGRRSYLRHVLGRDLSIYIYGMKLD